MMTPKYFSNDGSSEDDEVNNMKPSKVRNRQNWHKKSKKPFSQSPNQGGGKAAQQVERQNSYVSTTTATSNSTQLTDLGDMLPDPQSSSSDGSLQQQQVLEAQQQQDAVQKSNQIQTPKTPTTVGSDQSFLSLSSDDDMPVSPPQKNSFLARIEATLNENKEEVNSRIRGKTFTKSSGNAAATDTRTSQPKPTASSEIMMEPASSIGTPPIPEEFAAENGIQAGSDFTSLSSNTTLSAAAYQIMEKSLADLSTAISSSIGSKEDVSATEQTTPIANVEKEVVSNETTTEDEPAKKSRGHSPKRSSKRSSKSSGHKSPKKERKSLSKGHKSPNRKDDHKSSPRKSHTSSRRRDSKSPTRNRSSHVSSKAADSPIIISPGAEKRVSEKHTTPSGHHHSPKRSSKRSSRASGSRSKSPMKERKSRSKSPKREHKSRSKSPKKEHKSRNKSPKRVDADDNKSPSLRSPKKSPKRNSSGKSSSPKRKSRSSSIGTSFKAGSPIATNEPENTSSHGDIDTELAAIYSAGKEKESTPVVPDIATTPTTAAAAAAADTTEPTTTTSTENIDDFGNLATNNNPTTFVAMGFEKRTVPADTQSEGSSVPSMGSSNQSQQDKATKATTKTAPKDYEFVAINLNEEDEEEIIFEDNSTEVVVPRRPISPLSPSPTNDPNVRELEYVDVPLDPSLRNVNSKSPSQEIYSIPYIAAEEDEEAQLGPASSESMKVDILKDGGETSTACASSDLAGDSIIDSGSDAPGEPNDPTPEAIAAADKKKPLEEEGTSSRCKIITLVSCICVFVIGVAVVLPFSVDFTTIFAGAAIETPRPSVSMAPSSAPSISPAPSNAPSSNPSIYPTISNVPTIAPSGHPTVSMFPSLVPSISNAPTPSPSSSPTESMEPSANPSELPSMSPSLNPSESPSLSPTESKAPSSSPSSSPSVSPSAAPSIYPTRSQSPSSYPTNFPTLTPIAPPPLSSFKIRLRWDPEFFWQESKDEAWWCMECVKCAEYGGNDPHHHGCGDYGTGDESRCQAGDSIWVQDCRSRGNRFHVVQSSGREFMLRIARTNLCVERIKDKHPFLYLQGCEEDNPYQRFKPWNNYNKFELRPPAMNDCLSQAHHPKAGELLALHNCRLAKRDETLYWERY